MDLGLSYLLLLYSSLLFLACMCAPFLFDADCATGCLRSVSLGRHADTAVRNNRGSCECRRNIVAALLPVILSASCRQP